MSPHLCDLALQLSSLALPLLPLLQQQFPLRPQLAVPRLHLAQLPPQPPRLLAPLPQLGLGPLQRGLARRRPPLRLLQLRLPLLQRGLGGLLGALLGRQALLQLLVLLLPAEQLLGQGLGGESGGEECMEVRQEERVQLQPTHFWGWVRGQGHTGGRGREGGQVGVRKDMRSLKKNMAVLKPSRPNS